MNAYDLKRLRYDGDAVHVTRNGKGPGRVCYNGKHAGTVKVGKGGVLEFRPTRWVACWEYARFLRERAFQLYKQLMSRFKPTTNKVNWRRKRNRSPRARAERLAY